MGVGVRQGVSTLRQLRSEIRKSAYLVMLARAWRMPVLFVFLDGGGGEGRFVKAMPKTDKISDGRPITVLLLSSC